MKKLGLTIFFDVFALMLLGLTIVMSASSTYSVFKFDSVFYLFNSHLFKVVLGIGAIILFALIPYEYYRRLSKPVMIIITILLVVTLLFAPDIKGVHRWINFGIFSIQPADFARLALIIHCSFGKQRQRIDNYREGFVTFHLDNRYLRANNANQYKQRYNADIISLSIIYAGGAKLKHILA
jgi:cell division protein FtsW